MYFSFSVIFSFLAIFQVLQCAFLIFHFFSDFVIFQVVKWMFLISIILSFIAIFHVLQWTFLNFPPFSVLLAIFHALKCVFLNFRDFQFSRHIPGPTVCISYFSCFSIVLVIFQYLASVILISVIFIFSPYSWPYSGHF